jgi:heptosyltransferase-2
MDRDTRTLIVKLNATGDVLRTTPLLRRLPGQVTWITAPNNLDLLHGLSTRMECLPWADRQRALGTEFDLLINLEDEPETGAFASEVRCTRRFGAYLDGTGTVRYTDDASAWFDLSLVSRHGRAAADRLKLQNRRTYQEMIFEGLGYRFQGEPYLLPDVRNDRLHGDVALAPRSGPVWPMKNWAYYGELQEVLEARGLKVNVLPTRDSLLEHIADIRNHRCLVSGDSLPMHVALGAGIPCVSLFMCTSPWEIHDYGLQTKIVSPLLERFFYQRGLDPAATTAVPLEDVADAVLRILGHGRSAMERDDERSESVAP